MYSYTTWTLTKYLKKKLDGNYTSRQYAILNKSWKQQPTKQQLCGHLLPISQTIQVKHAAGGNWRSKHKLVSNICQWTPMHGHTSVDWPLKHQLCGDTGCCLENLPRVMANRDRWWKGVKGICPVGMPWW